ncbi:DNA topoisomerase 1 [Oryza brachyantha]|uniref:DNA topoisomerase n=1 Tax=Oryza brachyantha TaxID=4533 RepID=J3MD99_ORYBR|nr:DNA topoisomerase 1 [Oryza brachyantha]
MALQLRRLIPHRYASRAAALAVPPPPPSPAPAMLPFGVSQGYSYNFMPYSHLHPCEMCGVSLSNSSSRKLSSVSSCCPLQLKSGVFFTTGLTGNPNFVSLQAAYGHGTCLRANNIRNSRSFLTVCNKKLSFLSRNKSSLGNPNMRREDGSVAHSLFHRSEKNKSTLAACSTIADEALTSTSNQSKSITGTKKGTTRRKSSTNRKEVSEEMKEEKVSTKKQRKSVKTSTVAKSRKVDANQEEKRSDISKLKKGADSSKEKKASNRSKKSSKAKESAAAKATVKAEICTKTSVDSSGSEQKPLFPLYPPTAKSVLVVESVTKAKVIQKYLGDMYEVLPSYGHVRDLAGRSKSVRPDDDFSMVWEVPSAAWTHLKSIRMALKGAENLILASDPDREGEAIAWHIKEMLEQQDALGSNVTVARVVFHEITEDAVKKALMSPRYIEMNLVNAYLARRSLDYLIGFGISPLLWRKLPGCQSAGRVQSAALALVCDREAEIEQFNPQEYWTVDSDFKTQRSGPSNGLNLQSRIKHLNSKKLDQLSIRSQEEAHNIEKRIYSSQFEVIGIKRSKINKNPPMPYITSSLQQDAANKLHFSAGYTMKVAQKLYEGISLSSEEATGLITYMRTDGFHISDGAAQDILSLVKQRYGEEYASESIRKFFKKVKNAQEAHEAIRPTSIRRLPSSLVGKLDDDSLKLYSLIWKRTMACQMEASRTEMIQVDIGNSEGDMIFHSSASRLEFKGYQAVYDDTEASPSSHSSEVDAVHPDNIEALSKLEVKDLVSPVSVHLAQHFTKPPLRYSESALIKKLEELGIGRPSTYASIMKVLQDRNYVTIKSRVLHPEFRGRMVSAFLMHHFSEVADLSFTANMETELDNVSAGSTEWKGLLKDFWERFNKYCGDASRLDTRKVERMLEEKFSSILFADLDKDNRICPSCSQGTLRFKVSRYGEGYFIGCDGHPKCKYIARTLTDEDDETEASEETHKSSKPRLLGVLPNSGDKVFLKQGPYGYYVQVGEDRKGLSPKRAPLSEVKDIDSITLEDAIEILQYPITLGKHPDDDHPVLIAHSKAGFSIRHRRTLAPLPKSADPKKITLERAVKLLKGKNVTKFGRPKGRSRKAEEPLEWH